MRLELTGRHVDITPALRRLVDRKLARLERVLHDAAVSAQVVLTREKHSRRTDITLHARGEKFLHGVGSTTSWEASTAQAIDKLARQAKTVKGKWQERKRRSRRTAPSTDGASAPAAPVAEPVAEIKPHRPQILRASRQPVLALSIADAARQVDARADAVVVFRDVETTTLCVLFRGSTGELTLVETEVD
jgi:putative sigma-54 modulation protein